MNREIKFRAWDGNSMAYYPELKNWNTEYCNLDEDGVILMQYTGLKDKNGKEIYEGDIVKYSYWIQTSCNPDSLWKSFNGIGLIYFVDGCFMVKDKITIPLHYSELLIEIIGNIYENPELLNK